MSGGARLRTALVRARIDALIGWHQGVAERAERTAAEHRKVEQRWRVEYARRWPSPYRSASPTQPTATRAATTSEGARHE